MSVSVYVELAARDRRAARGLCTALMHTDADVPLSVCGPGSRGAREWLDALPSGERIRVAPSGPLQLDSDDHIVVLDARTLVVAGWLPALQQALADDPGPVATVSPLTLGSGPAPLCVQSDAGDDLDGVAAALRGRAAGPPPRVPAPAAGCMLVARSALQLAGPLDGGFAARCVAGGMLHVLATDTIVGVAGAPPTPSETLAEEHEWRRDQDELEPRGRARALARRAIDGLSVTLDGRTLSGSIAGTQVHTLELAAALHRTGRLRLRVVVPPDLQPEAENVLASLEGVELLPAVGVDQTTPRSDIVHRPYQISSAADAKLLRRIAGRRIITHQDLLGYHNPTYHRSVEIWEAHRRLTRAALAVADLVVVFSRHVAADLLAEDLADPTRLEVVPIGVDHALPGLLAPAVPPSGSEALTGLPFLACIGTDLQHKNRMFALVLVAALRERGWDGRLALAGSRVATGGSAEAELAWRTEHPLHAAAIVDVGPVDEPGKAWLYENAAAVVYPTTSEGFGLVPFEAADAGTPCLHGGGTALDELLPGTATLERWDAERSSDRVLRILRDPVEAEVMVERVASAGARLRWDFTADQLLRCYDAVLAGPPTAAASMGWTSLAAEDRLGHLEGLHAQLLDTIGPTGLSLVGPERLLPYDAQRTLAAVARQPLTRTLLLSMLSGLRRAAHLSARAINRANG